MASPVRNQYPIFITCRDRLQNLVELVDWLEGAGQHRIYLVDNDSTYPPLLEWYKQTTHRVIHLRTNLGPQAPWASGVIRSNVGSDECYCVTDPDIIPVEQCPIDALDFFHETLLRFPKYRKVGFGLKTDDLPPHFRFRKAVVSWERQFWIRQLAPGLYDALIDTTFAMYIPGSDFSYGPAIRTGWPYVARHAAWYTDSRNPSQEERYYRMRFEPEFTHWSGRSTRRTLKRLVTKLVYRLRVKARRALDTVMRSH